MFNPPDTFPYIGLRPFSEEDSLYFKGRDEQILQLTALLEANKFLMVTGASGDGKSSLVYAGIIPNARAGFFKARYSNWIVADFRPERSPLYNLSKSISRNLRISNEESVEVELRRGFSSLVETYKSSSLYIDEESDSWIQGDEASRKDMQRNAANLLIVADQFEEFFTNPENYYRNSPSADSQLVINLLLETARISIEKNLPIYVLCTMRSDYIGQCAAFRGLPEFIGFSQFFVPRLKRKEIVQVVKEPAFLHGDRISNRLVERVVYDLGEGIDQLPVLEHAMNEVWIEAKQGQEELDLIHYAMAGGMSPDDLPAEDMNKFKEWFESVPAKLSEAFLHPGLSQIIDAHANKLYLSAADHYNQNHKNKISTADAQLIIKTTFVCLTKMDEGRAVRNRMTLQEITDILARPDLSYKVVGGVLNIFREPGNTFLRPYITDNPESQQLIPDTVLDITHESLIRNWELLTSWAGEEYNNLTVYLDFKKQMDRWLESNKSKGFLLPIGPLTFFENWHSKLNPNKYWVNRYLDPGPDKESRLMEGNQIILDTEEFLKSSAGKVRVTRMVVKYGAAKIAAVIGIIFMIGLCGFYYMDARKKENGNVIKRILAEGKELITKKGVPDRYRTLFFMLSEQLSPGSFREIMNVMPDEEKATSIAGMHLELIWGSSEANPSIRHQSLYYLDSIIQSVPVKKSDPGSLMRNLKAMDLLITPSLILLYSHSDPHLQNIVDRSLRDIAEIVKVSFTQNFNARALDIASVNSGIEYALHYKTLDEKDIRLILANISPFEGTVAQNHFSEYYPLGKFLMYSASEEINHLGGYQELAYLYASLGDAPKVEMCVDSLLKLNANYPSQRNNIFNIANYFITYGKEKTLGDLISWYCKNQKISHAEFLERWLSLEGILTFEFLDYKLVMVNHNPNLELSDLNSIEKVFDLYHDIIIKESKGADELNFNLALYYKQRGAWFSKIYKEKEHIIHTVSMYPLFEKAVEHYRKVSSSYLDQITEITVRQDYSIVQQKIRRKDLFLYPDHYQKVFNNREFSTKYYTDKYIDFLLTRGYFSSMYRTPNDLGLINTWLSNYFERKSNSDIMHYAAPIKEQVLVRIDSVLSIDPSATGLNNNLVRLLLIEKFLESKQYGRIDEVYKKLEPERFTENLKSSLIGQTDFYYLVNRLTGYLAREGRTDEVIRITRVFSNPANRIKTYSMTTRELLAEKNEHHELAFILLDSAICELNRTRNFEFGFDWNQGSSDPRKALVLALSWVGGQQMHSLAGNYVEQIPISRQDDMLALWVDGTAGSKQYYPAYTSIPDITSAGERLNDYNRILLQECIKRSMDNNWKEFIEGRIKVYKWEFLQYDPELF
jgi:energy-coupling factor transporter ATP-binding protein EcfA2